MRPLRNRYGRRPAPAEGPDVGPVGQRDASHAGRGEPTGRAARRQIIAVREDGGEPPHHVTALLDAHAADLDQRIAELTALREDIRGLRDRADGSDPARCAEDMVCHVLPVDRPPGPPEEPGR
ncbi:MerR family DNA-binding protein [Blastococcus saxobsidens]|uniref:Transcriptional regulator, MerR family n=1 Tax=Blastococcus saxobsidens (strain DD2) TaxID=1146883 RepID=H6RIL5_BLASD|nr:MerR family DNA-binding protein [Blastococcus saxobsidens]CCG02209.1 Transcriptional regulator, MerR family [Blastococcus saxobsidens DD2]